MSIFIRAIIEITISKVRFTSENANGRITWSVFPGVSAASRTDVSRAPPKRSKRGAFLGV